MKLIEVQTDDGVKILAKIQVTEENNGKLSHETELMVVKIYNKGQWHDVTEELQGHLLDHFQFLAQELAPDQCDLQLLLDEQKEDHEYAEFKYGRL